MSRIWIILKLVAPIWSSTKANVNIFWSEESLVLVSQDFSELSFVKYEHIIEHYQTQEGKCPHEMKTINNILILSMTWKLQRPFAEHEVTMHGIKSKFLLIICNFQYIGLWSKITLYVLSGKFHVRIYFNFC